MLQVMIKAASTQTSFLRGYFMLLGPLHKQFTGSELSTDTPRSIYIQLKLVSIVHYNVNTVTE